MHLSSQSVIGLYTYLVTFPSFSTYETKNQNISQLSSVDEERLFGSLESTWLPTFRPDALKTEFKKSSWYDPIYRIAGMFDEH